MPTSVQRTHGQEDGKNMRLTIERPKVCNCLSHACEQPYSQGAPCPFPWLLLCLTIMQPGPMHRSCVLTVTIAVVASHAHSEHHHANASMYDLCHLCVENQTLFVTVCLDGCASRSMTSISSSTLSYHLRSRRLKRSNLVTDCCFNFYLVRALPCPNSNLCFEALLFPASCSSLSSALFFV